jgi:transposase
VQPPPKYVSLSAEQAEVFITELHRSSLEPSLATAIAEIIRTYVWLIWSLRETTLSLKRFRQMIFGAPAKAPQKPCAQSETDVDGPPQSSLSSLAQSEAAPEPRRRGGHLPGQGRLGSGAYGGAKRIACRHDELQVGQRCPVCGRGRLYDVPAGVEMRIDGHALLSAIRYDIEKLRCSACGQVFSAKLAAEAGVEKYTPRAKAVLALGRYYLGVPFYRLQSYQTMLGVPVPDATQWDQIEHVGNCSYRVFAALETLAAQGELIYQDDTLVRMLSLMKENQQIRAHAHAQGLSRPPERTGMFTTALVVRVGERTIYLYYSGRSHAGENLAALLAKRQADQPAPLVMSDALSHNDIETPAVIRCHCLVHGRRQFSDLEEVFPSECRGVIDLLSDVFDHDEHTRKAQMSPAARLAYHQVLSGPLMDELKGWLAKQVADRLIEPNSALGKAIAYMQAHWATLTRFLQIENAPLDNNLVERALKLFIRQRKNSLFYKNEHSAYIASVLTSLIATCLHAGINALDYLVALQENRRAVFAHPEQWLPWVWASSRASP